MAIKAQAQILGYIKAAEMELSEAAYKLGDGEFGTARHCLEVVERELVKAVEALNEAEVAAHAKG